MGKLGTRVAIAIPTTRAARKSPGWIDAIAGLQMPLGSSAARLWVEDMSIADARISLCKQALALDSEYIFFVSDDVLPPANALLIMLDKIGREFPVTLTTNVDGRTESSVKLVRADMITGVYWTKTYPPEPYLWKGLLKGSYRDWKAGDFFPIDFAGCDCLLIDTRVLRGIAEPWFSIDWAWEKGQKPSKNATEDYYFYSKAKAAGFNLWADTSVQCMHEDRSTGAYFGLTRGMRQADDAPITKHEDKIMAADIGCGFVSAVWGEETTLVRFDGRADVKPDVLCDVSSIPDQYFGKFDYIYASHVLEHFPRKEVQKVLRHWLQLGKVGCKVHILVPNMAKAFELILSAVNNPDTVHPYNLNYSWQMIYGDQTYDTAFHKCGFVKRSLEKLLIGTGVLGDIVVEETEGTAGSEITAKATIVKSLDESLTEILNIDVSSDSENGHTVNIGNNTVEVLETHGVGLVGLGGEVL